MVIIPIGVENNFFSHARKCHESNRGLTFPLEAVPAEEADHGEELGDLLQIHDRSVVQMDDGHRLLVIG